MRPTRSSSAPVASASNFASDDAATPAAQTFVRAAMRSPDASATPVGVDVGDHALEERRHAE